MQRRRRLCYLYATSTDSTWARGLTGR